MVNGVYLRTLLVAISTVLANGTASGHEIIRHASPNVPVATSILVPAGVDVVFVGGTLPDVANPEAPAGSAERLGDTATQAASVLDKIAKELAASGCTFADVVKLNVYLVADPRKGGVVDYDGLMRAYIKVYGLRAQEKALPTRTTVQVLSLPVPGALVQMEAVAAKHDSH